MNAYVDYDHDHPVAVVSWPDLTDPDRDWEQLHVGLPKAIRAAQEDAITSRIIIVIYAPEVLA